ncbi:hypothetical protein niasHS_003754 [Heterodera schachtii]|uniref:Uncharacterized protein n=1 Tax=Heterodera schachtii TaxID=97005 RepID=A0ABD2KHE2_HETSC
MLFLSPSLLFGFGTVPNGSFALIGQREEKKGRGAIGRNGKTAKDWAEAGGRATEGAGRAIVASAAPGATQAKFKEEKSVKLSKGYKGKRHTK